MTQDPSGQPVGSPTGHSDNAPADPAPNKVLIIKLGALGDMVQSLGPMAAIRHHHPNAHITALTTAPYEMLLRASGYVDDVWLDTKPRWFQPGRWNDLRSRLHAAEFHRVYDLQTSDRSSFYHHLLWPGPFPEWSGIARGCSHPHANPERDTLHTIDRQSEQLFDAGIPQVPLPDLSWADSDTRRFDVSEPLCLIAPGGAPHRPAKRWPSEHFAALAHTLTDIGVTPVLIGATAESGLLSAIAATCPGARNLCGETSFLDLAALARRAAGAVGNDTGPMHLLAAAGCPCTVLFSGESDPVLCAPRGLSVTFLRQPDLRSLAVSDVMASLREIAPGIQLGVPPDQP